MYVGSGTKIHTFDLRMESLVLNSATQSTRVYNGAEDEINQVQYCQAHCYVTESFFFQGPLFLLYPSPGWMREKKGSRNEESKNSLMG